MNSRNWLATLSPAVQAIAEEWPEATRRILPLMAVFDRPDCSLREIPFGERVAGWQPRPGIEQEAFTDLISEENRPFLAAWYSESEGMNLVATEFLRIIEHAIGGSVNDSWLTVHARHQRQEPRSVVLRTS